MKVKKDIRDRVLETVADVVIKHPWVVLGTVLLLFGISLFLATKLELRLSFLDEMREDSPVVKAFKNAYKNYGGIDFIFFTIEGGTRGEKEECAELLGEKLKGLREYIKEVRYKVDRDFFRKYALLFFSEEELEDFHTYLSQHVPRLKNMFSNLSFENYVLSLSEILDYEILEREEISGEDDLIKGLKRMKDWIVNVNAVLNGDGKVSYNDYKDSMEKVFFLREKLGPIRDEYMFNDERTVLAVIARPARPLDDYGFNIETMKHVDEVVEEVMKRFPHMKIGVTGPVPVLRDEYVAVKRDSRLTTLISFICIMLLFMMIYRGLFHLFFVGIPLIFGLVYTLGFAYISIGYLTIITSVFGTFLLGMGIDFAVHIVSRFGEEYARTGSYIEGVRKSITGTGKGMLTGAITTSAAFFTLLVAHYRGLNFIGEIVGTGLMLTFLVILLLLPAFFRVAGERLKRAGEKVHSASKIMERWSKVVERHPYAIAIIFTGISVFMLINALKVEFDYNFRGLLPENLPSVKTVMDYERRFGKSIDYGLVIADTLEEARVKTKALKDSETMEDIDSITNFIPENQDAKIPFIRKIEDEVRKIDVNPVRAESTIQGTIKAIERLKKSILAVKQLSILGGYFEGEDLSDEIYRMLDETTNLLKTENGDALKKLDSMSYNILEEIYTTLKEMSHPRKLGFDDLPQDIKEHYVGKDGKFLIYAYPVQTIWEQKFMEKFVAELKAVDEDAFGTGVMFLTVVKQIMNDLERSILYAGLAVFFFLLLDFKSIIKSLLALVPLSMGAIWMVGTMKLLGIKFNFINVSVVALLLGIGIDYAVHILHRFEDEEREPVRMALVYTGMAVVISALTTMIGFGSLEFASFTGLRRYGEVLFLGVGYCMITALTVFPALLHIFMRFLKKQVPQP